MDSDRQDGFSKDDPLWDVLDHASKPPAPSPYFARRVLREIDGTGPSETGWGWFQRFRFTQAWVPVAAAIALVAAAGHFWLPATPPVDPPIAEPVYADDNGQLPINPEQRISVVLADLDDLIAFEDSQIPDDDSAWQ